MSFSRLRAIISTVCIFHRYTRSEEMPGSEQHQVASCSSRRPECTVMQTDSRLQAYFSVLI